MPRTITLNEAMELGHRIAVKHVDRHKKPNAEAFWREWDGFVAATHDKYTDLDFRIIVAYAAAALRYDRKYEYPTDRPIGLWARQWTNAATVETSEAA